MFVLEIRGTETLRRPNNRSYFQTDLRGIEGRPPDQPFRGGRLAPTLGG